jgi:hypothetical protein
MLLKFRSCLGDLAGCFVLAATRIDLVRVTGAGSALAALEWVSTGGFDGDRASNVTEVRMDLARFELEADPAHLTAGNTLQDDRRHLLERFGDPRVRRRAPR